MKKPVFIYTIALIALTGVVMVQAASHQKTTESASTSEGDVQNVTQKYGASGLIVAVDIQDKTIQIGKNVYGLADGVQVVNKDNLLMSQLALLPGERIEYQLAAQPLNKGDNSPLPMQVMTHIRIVSGLIEDKVQK